MCCDIRANCHVWLIVLAREHAGHKCFPICWPLSFRKGFSAPRKDRDAWEGIGLGKNRAVPEVHDTFRQGMSKKKGTEIAPNGIKITATPRRH